MSGKGRIKIVDTWVRQEQFNGKIDIETVLDYVRSEKATGQLVFHLTQGGVQRAEFVKRIPAEIIP
jgi:hypothetical protein